MINRLTKILLKISPVLALSLFISSRITAQTFGFGCLGLSGFYAGYSQYSYTADGLNQSLVVLNPGVDFTKENLDFKLGTGYRIGANIFRARFRSLFISAKGYYQFLKETKDFVSTSTEGVSKNTYQLSLNHWGVAMDFGFPVFGILDLKLVEGGVNFYNGEFTATNLAPDNTQTETKFEPADLKVGYYVGSGLVLHLIPDYISIEGTAFYTFMHLDDMKDGNGILLPDASVNSKFITRGGFSATVQLNVGFPL